MDQTPTATVINIPAVHPSINEWKKWHYHKYNSEKQVWKDMIYVVARGGHQFKGKVKVTITYYFPDKRSRDIDNYTPKFIMDGLVSAEIIEDDNQRIVTSLTTRFLYDKNNPRTEVLIEKDQL